LSSPDLQLHLLLLLFSQLLPSLLLLSFSLSFLLYLSSPSFFDQGFRLDPLTGAQEQKKEEKKKKKKRGDEREGRKRSGRKEKEERDLRGVDQVRGGPSFRGIVRNG